MDEPAASAIATCVAERIATRSSTGVITVLDRFSRSLVAAPRLAASTLATTTLVATALLSADAFGQHAGTIDAVTVYRGQALVTRSVPLPSEAGLHEVIVTDLPARILSGSISAASDGADVRSVRFRTRPIGEALDDEDREELVDIDEELQELGDVDQSLNDTITLSQKQLQYLDALATFTQRVNVQETEDGTLSAENVAQLSRFIFEEQERLTAIVQAAQIERRSIAQRRNELERRRRVITGSNTRIAREAVVFVDVTDGGGTLDVNYLVGDATWSPSYNVRSAEGESVRFEYQASVVQNSGEDWGDVALTLSTATPAMVASAPPLDALTIVARPNIAQRPRGGGGEGGGSVDGVMLGGRVSNVREYLDNRVQLIERQRSAVRDRLGNLDRSLESLQIADDQLNDMAKQMAALELSSNFSLREQAATSSDPETGIAVAYRIENDVTMPSRPDAQLIRIARLALPATFSTVATPVLSEMVFTEAETLNTSRLVFLPGPASSYLDGQFVGHGYVPAITSGESMTLGFGVDASLRTRRELVERVERISGGNKIVHMTYRLTVENFGGDAAEIILRDRLPVAQNSSVVVDLVETSEPVSDERAYLEGDRKDGILAWPLTIPAGAVGADAVTVEFTFTLEHDRQLIIDLDE